MISLINFYHQPTSIRFSHFQNLKKEFKNEFLKNQKGKQASVQILAFCFMQNHFHLILKQISEKGISDFMRKFQHSYSKYFNLKNKRSGSLFQSMFKAVRIETDEQLIHVSRYIHLNPTTSFVIDNSQLENYQWSSLTDYLGNKVHEFVESETILATFKTPQQYLEFVKNQLSYQQELDKIKHLALE